MRFGLVLIAYSIIQHGIINARISGLDVIDDGGLGSALVILFYVAIVMDVTDWISNINDKFHDK